MSDSISTLEIGQTCEKCNKTIWADAHPDAALLLFSTETDVVEKGLSKFMAKHQLHLCTEREHDFATCSAKDTVFGNCVGNDNVIECGGFLGGKQ